MGRGDGPLEGPVGDAVVVACEYRRRSDFVKVRACLIVNPISTIYIARSSQTKFECCSCMCEHWIEDKGSCVQKRLKPRWHVTWLEDGLHPIFQFFPCSLFSYLNWPVRFNQTTIYRESETNSLQVLYPPSYFFYLSCSCKIGVRYSATLSVSTATSIVATPVAGAPVKMFWTTRFFSFK